VGGSTVECRSPPRPVMSEAAPLTILVSSLSHSFLAPRERKPLPPTRFNGVCTWCLNHGQSPGSELHFFFMRDSFSNIPVRTRPSPPSPVSLLPSLPRCLLRTCAQHPLGCLRPPPSFPLCAEFSRGFFVIAVLWFPYRKRLLLSKDHDTSSPYSSCRRINVFILPHP